MATLKDLNTYKELTELVEAKRELAIRAKKDIYALQAQIDWAQAGIEECQSVIDEYEDLKIALGKMLEIMTGRN